MLVNVFVVMDVILIFTSERSQAYDDDTSENEGEPNSFVEQFVCNNINCTQAVMDEYKQCTTSPVFATMFYDYDSEQHRLMILKQLTPYSNAIGACITKLWQMFFIWFFTKAFAFAVY